MTGDENVDIWRFDNPGERDLIAPIAHPAAIFDSDAVSDNGQPELVSLDSPTFDARGHSYIGISFDHYFSATDGENNYIYVDVYDGAQWHEVYASGQSSLNPDHLLIDVSDRLAGVPNARISFRFGGNNDLYWIVDNVQVIGAQQPLAEIAVTHSAPEAVVAGAPFSYVFTVTNQSDTAVTGVVVTDTLPALVTFDSSSAPCGVPDIEFRIVCTVGALGAREHRVMTVNVSAPALGARLTSDVVVTGDTDELRLANNRASVTTTVHPNTQPGDRYVATGGADTTNCANPAAPCRTLDFAILNAHPNDVVHIAAGVYATSVQIDRPLTIRGAGFEETVLDGENAGRVLAASAPLHLKDLSVINGRTEGNGGGLLATAPFTLTGVFLGNNYSGGEGGGFYADPSAELVVISNTQVISNVAVGNGGGGYSRSGLRMTAGVFEQNRCTREAGSAGGCSGGGLHNRPIVDADVEIVGSRFAGNASTQAGGGGVLGAPFEHFVKLNSVEFTDNRTQVGNGGGAFLGGVVVADDLLFQGNHAGRCGGAFLAEQHFTMTNSRVAENSAASLGGGAYFEPDNIEFRGTMRILMTDVTFEGNQSDSDGGGIFLTRDVASIAMTRTHFLGNSAQGYGGGIRTNVTVPVSLNDSVLDGNLAVLGAGGGAYLLGRPNLLSGVTVMNNSAALTGTTESLGGGLYVAGSMTLSNSKVISNTAYQGGGLYLNVGTGFFENQLRVTNALLAENRVRDQGAALYIFHESSEVVTVSSDTHLLHTTIAAAQRLEGAAVYMEAGTIGITNTIIANHAVGIQRNSGTAFEDYNLFFDNGSDRTGEISVGNHSVQADPRFVNPAGGDYRLSAGSAAIDAGAELGVTHDLAQAARPQGDGVDIGAYESQHGPVTAQHDIYLPLVGQ